MGGPSRAEPGPGRDGQLMTRATPPTSEAPHPSADRGKQEAARPAGISSTDYGRDTWWMKQRPVRQWRRCRFTSNGMTRMRCVRRPSPFMSHGSGIIAQTRQLSIYTSCARRTTARVRHSRGKAGRERKKKAGLQESPFLALQRVRPRISALEQALCFSQFRCTPSKPPELLRRHVLRVTDVRLTVRTFRCARLLAGTVFAVRKRHAAIAAGHLMTGYLRHDSPSPTQPTGPASNTVHDDPRYELWLASPEKIERGIGRVSHRTSGHVPLARVSRLPSGPAEST
jgi:hypothetical protein